MRLNPTARDGLSLLEVLVSLAIFMMALTALVYLVNNSSTLALEAQSRSRCAQLARSKINEMAAGALPLEGQSEASFDEEPLYRWSSEVGEGGAPGLFNVTVTVVFRPDDPYPVKVALSRMILDPKVTGSTQDVPAMPSVSGDESGSDTGGTTTPAAGGTTTPPPGTGGTSSPTTGGANSGGAKTGSTTMAGPSMGGGASGGGAMGGGNSMSGPSTGGGKGGTSAGGKGGK